MQAGFAFLEAGSVRSKNTTNIIMKNLLDVCKYIGVVKRGFKQAFADKCIKRDRAIISVQSANSLC